MPSSVRIPPVGKRKKEPKTGPFTGFFMGIIHAYLVTKTAALQGYMSLYNNGFSIGILAVLFFQTEKIISKLKAHKKGLS